MEFVLRAAAVPGLSVAQQIECTLEGAFACLRVGLQRKYAFLLYVAALLSADSENSYVPHSLVADIHRSSQTHSLFGPASSSGQVSKSTIWHPVE
jgi:hypothetical protein